MVNLWRMRLAGHMLRQPEERPAMNWLPEDGKRPRGRPQNTWCATCMCVEDLQDIDVAWRGAKRVASARQRWRNLVAQCSNENWRNYKFKSK